MTLHNNQTGDIDWARVTEDLKAVIDAHIAFEQMPVRFERHPRDGWAGYKGNRRITKFHFSEAAARADVQ